MKVKKGLLFALGFETGNKMKHTIAAVVLRVLLVMR